MTTVGNNIERIRLRHKPKITQKVLSERLGHANPSNVATWENSNQIPEPETIKRIAVALECEPWELLEGVVFPHDHLRRVPIGSPEPEGSDKSVASERAHSERLGQKEAGTVVAPTPVDVDQIQAKPTALDEMSIGEFFIFYQEMRQADRDAVAHQARHRSVSKSRRKEPKRRGATS